MRDRILSDLIIARIIALPKRKIMIIAYRSTQMLKLMIVGVSLAGFSIPVLANEPPIITNPKPLVILTGTTQDLQGIEEKNLAEWLGGVGGEYPTTEDSKESVYEVQQDFYVVKMQSLNLTLENTDTKLGDTQRITRRFPFTHF